MVEVPVVLKGLAPKESSSTLGTANYSAIPKVVVIGGGYEGTGIDKIREAIKETHGSYLVPFVKMDTTKVAPALGPERIKVVIARVKAALDGLQAEGKLDGSDTGIHLF